MLRYCEWKGVAIPCSKIFTKFPTDEGICCSFNIKAAEEIFYGKTFNSALQHLQHRDIDLLMDKADLPSDYITRNEPQILPGKEKGLTIILDAHTDALSPGTVESDYNIFQLLVSEQSSFPYFHQKSFAVGPGQSNVVTLSATKFSADDSMKAIPINARQCRFPDENDILYLHKVYSYTNCMFECSLTYAKMKTHENINSTCLPWYFPTIDDYPIVCDPWESFEFLNYMQNHDKEEDCDHCLDDCTKTTYDVSLTYQSFRQCDSLNFGLSRMCTIDNENHMWPRKFYFEGLEYIGSDRTVNAKDTRYKSNSLMRDFVPYSMYENDIAIVEIYFDKPTAIEIISFSRMTWVDYFANVGGILGLVLGMGFVSVIEILLLCIQMFLDHFHFKTYRQHLWDFIRKPA